MINHTVNEDIRSTVENISVYFDKFKRLQDEKLLEESDFELWKFT